MSRGFSPQCVVKPGEEVDKLCSLDSHRPERPDQVYVYVKNLGAVSVKNLVNFLLGKPHADTSEQLHWLVSVFRQEPANKFITRPGASSFFHRTPTCVSQLENTGGVLQLLRGIYQSVQFGYFGLPTGNLQTVLLAHLLTHFYYYS